MLKTFIKNNIVFLIALFLATITCFFVPPDIQYLNYFDLKTLTCLFCTLAVVNALKNINFFDIIAKKIVNIFNNTRSVIIALVYITFFGSMLIANDMALLTFLPLGYFVLISTDNEKYMAFCFIMQTIGANLGGMLTPFGNPQNLYIYNYFNIPNALFFKIMFSPFIVSVLLITLIIIIFIKKEPLVQNYRDVPKFSIYKTIYLLVLFLLSILIVFKVIPYYIGLPIIIIGIAIVDIKALFRVDYPLLLTFCAFFIFSGNMARIPLIDSTIGELARNHTLLTGVISCQLISNVPSAVLLSGFVKNYAPLLVAVNIGGTGTIISSLASLITLREFTHAMPGYMDGYLKKYTALNLFFLIILTLFSYFYL